MRIRLLVSVFCLSLLLDRVRGQSGQGQGGYSSGGYGAPAQQYTNPFIPSPPGSTPPCATHGSTFCEKVETYPTEVIANLLQKFQALFTEFIKSEIDQEFFMMHQTYGYGGYSYGPQQGGYSNHQQFPALTYDSLVNATSIQQQQQQQQQQQGGYPNHNQQQQQSHTYYQGQPQYQNNNQQQHDNLNGGYNTINHAVAAIPPILHSFWWNHRDRTTRKASFPYLMVHKVRPKRQTTSETQLCPVRSQFIVPRAAMNNKGNWLYVVNMDTDQRFIQMVKSEVCAGGDGSQCSGLCSIPPGFRATCRQQYVQKRLVSLSESGDRLRNDVFWFPHCCLCQIT